MFKNYNSTQKLALIACAIVFILVNLFSVAVVINTIVENNNPTITDKPISVTVVSSSRTTSLDYGFGENISISQGDFKTTAINVEMIGVTPADFILNENDIQISNGIVLIKPALDLKMNIQGSEINLLAGGSFVFISSSNTITVLMGEAEIDGEIVSMNKIVTFAENGDYSVSEFNRASLSSNEDYLQLSVAATNLKEDVPELTDTVSPRILVITPESGYETTDSSVDITGKSEIGAVLKFNGSLVSSDAFGNFSADVELEMGRNEIKVTISDVYGNVSEISLFYTRL